MEDKNKLVSDYIVFLVEYLKEKCPNVSFETKINVGLDKYLNSDLSFDRIKEELDNEVAKLIKEYNKQERINSEKKYDLNEFFNCRISHNTLHIHVVPKSILEDINSVGLKNYLGYVNDRLLDAFYRIPLILSENEDVNTVLAVSPLLKVKRVQEIFKNYGFNIFLANSPMFLQMFDGKKAYQAKISKDEFLERFNNKKGNVR